MAGAAQTTVIFQIYVIFVNTISVAQRQAINGLACPQVGDSPWNRNAVGNVIYYFFGRSERVPIPYHFQTNHKFYFLTNTIF